MSDQPQDGVKTQSELVRRLGVFAWICAGIVLLWFLSWKHIDILILDEGARGQFGDKFGAINSLFSGLAFATLIYALYLQMEELRLQRKELELTRDEMRGQKEEFSEQNKTLKQQRFENTFFQMLSNLDSVMSMVRWRPPAGGPFIYSDNACSGILRRVWDEINKKRHEILQSGSINSGVLEKILDDTHERSGGSLKNYFSYLYVLMKFVHDGDVEDRGFYAEIVRSQLPSNVRNLLFYYSVVEPEKRLRPYVDEYALLENLMIPPKFCPSDCILFFSERAYGGTRPEYNAEVFQRG